MGIDTSMTKPTYVKRDEGGKQSGGFNTVVIEWV